MKANELRIGNYVLGPLGEIAIIDIIGSFNYPEYIHGSYKSETGSFSGQNGFSGIPLTPEILEKCGFEKTEDERVYFGVVERTEIYEKDIIQVHFDNYGALILYGSQYDMNRPKHLHQLQNLYFTLTGEELEVNL